MIYSLQAECGVANLVMENAQKNLMDMEDDE